MSAGLRLSKYEAAGNDFLVLVDRSVGPPLTAEAAVALCHRRFGVGADGLLRCWPAGRGRVGMELRNADGSFAETSGNGLRCLAQAAVMAGLADPPRVVVETPVGPREVELAPGRWVSEGWATVAMGRVALDLSVPTRGPARRVALADVGNPHLVAEVEDPAAVDLVAAATDVAAERASSLNVELVAPRNGGLVLRVLERGAGETLACGSGSVAAASAARAWGLVGDHVDVVNPGGILHVTLREDEATVGGIVRHVADIVCSPAVAARAGWGVEETGVAENQ